MTNRHHIIIGCGYLGRRVAQLLLSSGDKVSALTRSEPRAEEFRSSGIEPIVGDVVNFGSTQLPAADTLIYAVGFDRMSQHSKRQVYVDGLSNVLAAATSVPSITYVSSTSVYGQADSEWVDEASATEPKTEGGQICLEAENLLRHRRPDATIVRLAGIYGPSRLLRRVDSLRTNEPIAGNPDAYLNLIHVDDAANLVSSVINSPTAERVYLGTDGNPATRRDFYRELARLIDVAEPKFDASLPARNGASGRNKRCRSAHIDQLPGFELQFPSMQQGLTHAVEHTKL